MFDSLMFNRLKRSSTFVRFRLNTYMPYFGAGVRLTQLDFDAGIAQVEMSLNVFNRNIVGTQFGGSLYAMIDPLYMLLLMHQLGDDYVVWDKAAKIDFISPGRGRVTARIELAPEEIQTIKQLAADNRSVLRTYPIDIFGADDKIVAHVEKVLYIRRKKST
jgi:acyl-coenzyme A thioesterase PaaI-like protein